MSRLSQKQRKETIRRLGESLSGHHACFKTKDGQKFLSSVEDTFFKVLHEQLDNDEYHHALFHAYFLCLHAGSKILKVPIVLLLPQKADELDMKMFTESKKPTEIPEFIPLRYSNEVVRNATEEPLPTIEDALKVKKLKSILKCDRCPPDVPAQVEWVDLQLRSIDEPSTIFAHCCRCGNRWKQ
jgi:DNA-directed RNA polymerase subunit M/transcription elongation factor TFIIS